MARAKTAIELQEYTSKIISFITKKVNVEKVILFGSYAKGSAHEWSDIDLAVISPDFKSKSTTVNSLRLISDIKLHEENLQLVCFSSQVFNNEDDWVDPGFIREIKNTGKVLYSQASTMI